MTNIEYIPAGRTSRINKSGAELQIQTEYAARPMPRLTTSVINAGQVIHKIQQELDIPITNEEEKFKVERMLQRQHVNVLKVVEKKDFSAEATVKEIPQISNRSIGFSEKLKALDGVVGIYRLDNDGNFDTPGLTKRFKKSFSFIAKNLLDIVNIFNQLPGGQREQGVVEIEEQKLYFVSSGQECYFLLHNGCKFSIEIERDIKIVLSEKSH